MAWMGKVIVALAVMSPLMAQAAPASTLAVPCAVRIRPRAAADYDPSAELVLSGTVVAAQTGSLRLQLAFGTVRVDLGSAAPLVTVGEQAVVTVSRLQDGTGQRFVARELRSAEGDQVLRDAEGVPVAF
jgi:hypothetical protein